MDDSKRRVVASWMAKADRDLRSARRLYSDRPPLLDTAAYHCQQAAEKALKAFLSLHDVPFQRTHLLSPLVLQCMQRDPEFETHRRCGRGPHAFRNRISLSGRSG